MYAYIPVGIFIVVLKEKVHTPLQKWGSFNPFSLYATWILKNITYKNITYGVV